MYTYIQCGDKNIYMYNVYGCVYECVYMTIRFRREFLSFFLIYFVCSFLGWCVLHFSIFEQDFGLQCGAEDFGYAEYYLYIYKTGKS